MGTSTSLSAEKLESAYFAGGCFWGVEYYFEKVDGVKAAISGYMGGHTPTVNYQAICTGTTGHIEVVKIEFDSSKVSFETLAKLFFEIHNPEQTNGQGPDIGSQYISAIFYVDEDQKKVSEELIKTLSQKGFKIATKLLKAEKFHEAEEYHQDYYERKGSVPYCHSYIKRF
ncbi:MAG: peptide-methionine (S)-S-oxide reductase MsrA [Helicobacteraceae bacterium]|nr:peptide-methionine (S)-S-oxide reductase MsrA [Helicobacteraceae bacterium]